MLCICQLDSQLAGMPGGMHVAWMAWAPGHVGGATCGRPCCAAAGLRWTLTTASDTKPVTATARGTGTATGVRSADAHVMRGTHACAPQGARSGAAGTSVLVPRVFHSEQQAVHPPSAVTGRCRHHCARRVSATVVRQRCYSACCCEYPAKSTYLDSNGRPGGRGPLWQWQRCNGRIKSQCLMTNNCRLVLRSSEPNAKRQKADAEGAGHSRGHQAEDAAATGADWGRGPVDHGAC